ncbi:MAG TPA: hypothetical protein VFE14_20985 [Micromonosporaceae bacterium]|jgi:hypothetical protein|nr:hypothetical protein [Micromonosporaceae bacterium]
MTRLTFRHQNTAITTGIALMLAGAWCLYDAWERRGQRPPWPVRVVSWW